MTERVAGTDARAGVRRGVGGVPRTWGIARHWSVHVSGGDEPFEAVQTRDDHPASLKQGDECAAISHIRVGALAGWAAWVRCEQLAIVRAQ